jgi:hypothetical protein
VAAAPLKLWQPCVQVEVHLCTLPTNLLAFHAL